MVRRDESEQESPQGRRALDFRRRCSSGCKTRLGIASLNPVLRGWGNYFGTGNAALKFGQVDEYVVDRLRTLRVKRKGRNLGPGEARKWTRGYFEALGLVRLRGTIRYPEAA